MLSSQNKTSNSVYPGSDTPSFSTLSVFIKAANDRNLGVFLKPLIVCEDDTIMVNITPSDPTQWFSSYSYYMIQLAVLSANYPNVGILAVGVELFQLTANTDYLPLWVDLIKNMRLNYFGNLTYCSIMYPEETQHLGFWEELDFISMDTYVPLSNGTGPDPTFDQMSARLAHYFYIVENWRNSTHPEKSILISEFGYPSSSFGMVVPYESPHTCENVGSNVTLQVMAVDAFLTNAKTQVNVMGVNMFWLDNPSSFDYYENRNNNSWACSWTVRGKPAGALLSMVYWGLPIETIRRTQNTTYI